MSKGQEELRRALQKAYDLGQIYCHQADSEYASYHRKAEETQAKFAALIEEACRQQAPAEQEPAAWLYERDGSDPVVSTLRQLMPSGSGWKETRLYTAPQRVAELEALLFEIGQGCSKREMPSEQTLNDWFDRIDAALAKHGEA